MFGQTHHDDGNKAVDAYLAVGAVSMKGSATACTG